jgi:TfoX/Sxy family transcriptional regulator of competence genes
MEEILLVRMRDILTIAGVVWEEKRMMGGQCFMVDDKMCFGTYKGGLMCRIEPNETEIFLKRQGAELMIHGGRPMNGYLFITNNGYDSQSDLAYWISKCLEFNPKAKSSKKKK